MNRRRESFLTNPAFYLCVAGAFTATATAPLAAQSHDPAPVRVALESYGARSGSSGNELRTYLDASERSTTDIVIAGGAAKQLGFLLLGADKAAVRGPLDTMLLVTPDVIVPLGQFDASGSARIPIDLVQSIRGSVYLQALSIEAELAEIRLSAGLRVRFAEGSVQPQLGYEGPESTAILIAEEGEVVTHKLLHRVQVPTTGWTLEETSRESANGVTRIYMTLEESANGATVFETKRSLIDLGEEAEQVVEVWIRQTHKTEPRPAPFELAARIERDF